MTHSTVSKQQQNWKCWQQSHHAAVGLAATQEANRRHNHNCIQSIRLLKEENEMLKNKVVSLKNKLEKLQQEHTQMRNNGILPGQLADNQKQSSEEEDTSDQECNSDE